AVTRLGTAKPSERHDRHARAAPFARALTTPASQAARVAGADGRVRSSADPRCSQSPLRNSSLTLRIPRMTQPRRGPWLGVSLFATLFLCGAAGAAAGQEAVIRGRVIDDRGDALPVATVQIRELSVGVFSGSDGRYTMLIPAVRVSGQTVTLRVRTIAHKPATRQLTLTPGEHIEDFTLVSDPNLLDAVVATGVQEATEQVKVPFNVTRIDASKLPVAAANPLTELQGKIPANIVSNSGRP